jgi:NADH dehydrogenase [ubiquinone] 1 alpha subcomplex assembly factor 5
MVVDEEQEWLTKFEPNTFDLIVNNMQLHWVNELETTLRAFNTSLMADGVFMGTMLGGDTL